MNGSVRVELGKRGNSICSGSDFLNRQVFVIICSGEFLNGRILKKKYVENITHTAVTRVKQGNDLALDHVGIRHGQIDFTTNRSDLGRVDPTDANDLNGNFDAAACGDSVVEISRQT